MTKIVYILLLATAIISAQTLVLPNDGLVGHWTFDNAANLEEAAVGNDLERDTVTIAGDINGFLPVSGPENGNGAVQVLLGSFYRCQHDIFPNGFDPFYPDSTPSRVNQYSLVIDFHIPNAGVWYAFHAGDNNGDPNDGDWESFIRPNGGLGVGSTGYSYYKVTDTEGWYRLIIVADLGVQYKYYLDGQLLQDGSPRSIDDRFSLDSPFNSNTVMFFGDESGEDANIDIAELALYERPLTLEEVETMGGYGHAVTLGNPVGEWDFGDESNLLAATLGTDLELSGSQNVVGGPDLGGFAAQVGVGSYYTATHGIKANGFQENAQKVNTYTISMDIKMTQPLTKYALFQTNAANNDDADFWIDELGRFGSDAIGWSDTSMFKLRYNDWYRVTLAVSQGDTIDNALLFIDGDSVMAVPNIPSDGTLALAPRDGDNTVLFFADDDGEDTQIEVAWLRVWNRAFSAPEMRDLRGYDHLGGDEYAPNLDDIDNKAFSFDGIASYANVTMNLDNATLPVKDMTVECWINMYQGLEWGGFIGAIQDNGGYEKGWVLGTRYETNTTFSFGLSTRGAGPDNAESPDLDGYMDYLIAGKLIKFDQWNHVAATYDGDTTKIFVNGVLLNFMLTQTGDIFYDNLSPFTIGSYHDDNEFFVTPGFQDEMRLWNVELSEQMIQDWMHKQITQDHPHYNELISNWTFDDLEGNVVPDLAGNNPAQLYAMPSSAYQPSTVPVGRDGAFINSQVPKLIGQENEGLKVTIVSDMSEPLLENLGVYLVGENDGSKVEGEPFDAQLNMRTPIHFGVDNHSVDNEMIVSFDLEFQYGMIAGLPDESELRLVKRKDLYDTWMDITESATQNTSNHTFTLAADTATAEYAIAWQGATAITDLNLIPNEYELSQNYPNPFNPVTKINYSIVKTSDVKLIIYNSLGQKIATIANIKRQKPGTYSVDWDASQFSSGVYFYRLKTDDFTDVKKMMLMK